MRKVECPNCHEVKEENKNNFWIDKTTKTGFYYLCKICARKQKRESIKRCKERKFKKALQLVEYLNLGKGCFDSILFIESKDKNKVEDLKINYMIIDVGGK